MSSEPAESSVPPKSSRRDFLKYVAGAVAGIGAAAYLVPMSGFVLGGMNNIKESSPAEVGPVDSFPVGVPVSAHFKFNNEDAYIRETVTYNVWVIRHSASELTVFSPVCTHLGCHFDWDAGAREFVCPCHASHFSAEGAVLAGPAPRGLDTLEHEIRDGVLYVMWERFELGVPTKIIA